VLITGVTGFVGRHLVPHCVEHGAEVFGIGRRDAAAADPPSALAAYAPSDLRDVEAVRRLIKSTRPDLVFHLAGVANLGDSWNRPRETTEAIVLGSSNLLEAMLEHAPDARVLIAGSAQEYGWVPADGLPIDERTPLRPQNPYGVSKACVDLLAGYFADAHGLHAVRTRAFNHTGPGQSDDFAIPSFARQIAEASARGAKRIELRTGNLGVRRDFTDVRDVVRAYRLALEHGAPGAVFNVCSGRPVELSDVVSRVAQCAGVEVATRVDPDRLRAGEPVEFYGSHAFLTAKTGWRPKIELDRTIGDLFEWWRERTRTNG